MRSRMRRLFLFASAETRYHDLMRRFDAANDNVPDDDRFRLPQRSMAIGAMLFGLLSFVICLHAKDIERAFRGPRSWPTLVSRDVAVPGNHR